MSTTAPPAAIQKRLVDVLFSVIEMNVKLLQTAAEIVGGTRELADSLGIGESLLSKFMAGAVRLPDALLLRAVDIVLAVGKHPLSKRTEVCNHPAGGKCATPDGGSGGGVA